MNSQKLTERERITRLFVLRASESRKRIIKPEDKRKEAVRSILRTAVRKFNEEGC